MYSKKSRGPKIQPCGTPHVISHLEKSYLVLNLIFFISI